MGKKTISLVLSVFLMLSAMAGCSADSGTPTTTSTISTVSEESQSSIKESYIETDGVDILADGTIVFESQDSFAIYLENKNENLKGKKIKVTDEIECIYEYCITLKQSIDVVKNYMPMFYIIDSRKLSILNEGDKVTVAGVISEIDEYMCKIENCEILNISHNSENKVSEVESSIEVSNQESSRIETSKVESSEQESSSSTSSSQNSNPFNTYDTPKQQNTTQYVLNTSTMKIHHASCTYVKKIAPENYAITTDLTGALAQGYEKCKKCW